MTDLAQLGLSLEAGPMLTGLGKVDAALDKTAAKAEALVAKIKTATGQMATAFKSIGTNDLAGSTERQLAKMVGGFRVANSQIRSLTSDRVRQTTADAVAHDKIKLNSAISTGRAILAAEKSNAAESLRISAARDKQAMAMRMQPILSTGSVGLPTKATSAFNEPAAPLYTASGIASVDKMRESLARLRVEEAALRAARQAGTISHLEYARGMDGITKATNLAVAGNTRARGVFRQTASAIASATFEITGAVYGLGAAVGILSAPAAFGFKLLSTLEQTKLGMAAILVSMGEINGEAVKLPIALEAAAGMTQRLQENALKYGVNITALADTTRSIMAPGLGAGLNLQEIEKLALAGSIAVKTIGLDSRQSVQEIRDLVAGGIQAASSTLARSLGINDQMVKDWTKAGTLYQNLMERLAGFQDTAILNTETLSGAWDIFVQKIQLAFANSVQFDAFKQKLIDLSNWIGKVDVNSGKFQFNQDTINSVTAYYEGFKATLDTLAEVGRFVSLLGPVIQTLAVLLVNTIYVIRMFAGEVKTMATQLVALAHLDFKNFKLIGSDWKKEAEAARIEVDRLSRSILGVKEARAGGSKLLGKWGVGAGSPWTKVDPALFITGKSAGAEEDKGTKGSRAVDPQIAFMENLRKEAATLGMGEEALKRYEVAKMNLARTDQLAADKLLDTIFAFKAGQEATKAWAEAQEEFGRAAATAAKAAESDAAAIAAQVAAQREHNEEIGLSAAALNDLEQSRFGASIAALQQFESERTIAGASNEELAAIWDKIDALKELKQLRGEGAEKQGSFDALKDLNDYLDPAKAKSFGDVLSNSFGKAGTAIGKMAGVFDEYAQKQAELAKKQAVYAKARESMSPADQIKMETALTEKQASLQVDAYADMAGAAKTFFDEGSTGYKVLSAAEQGFRAIQMALSIAAMVQGATETTASVAQSGTKAVASTAAGVAKAFEQMGVWGFVGAAAIIAFMASMGVRGGGGSSVSMSAQRQETQGTGTVLGDSGAKSESLSNSLEMLADVNTLTMQYSARMAKSLQNIEIALTGVSSMIFRTPGLTSGNLSGVQEMSKTGTLGFSSKSVAVSDSGLTYKGLISGIAEGLQSFTEVTTNKSSWFGLKKSTRTDTVLTDADDDVSQQFQMIFNNISDSLIAAGGVLGKSADILETQIANTEIDLGMVSLKGLKGDELEEALNAVISASADNIARQALPGLDKYQKVGEGYYETAVRVAYSTELVQVSLKAIDKGFAGAAMEIVDFSQTLIEAFGGLEAMGDAISGYYDAFYSEEEKLADTSAQLAAGFANLNMAMPGTKDEFRAMVDALDMTSASGREAFVALMGMAPAFAEVADAAADAAANIASERYGLETQLLQAQGNTAELRRRELLLIDASNVALQEQIWAIEDKAAAADAAANIASERYGLETQLLQVQGNTAELRRRELLLIDASNVALQEQIWAIEDKAAADAAASQAAADAAAAAQQLTAAWQSVTDTIFDEVRRIRGLLGANTGANAEAQFAIATAQARAGDQDAAKLLPALSRALLDQAAVNASTAEDLARIQGRTAGSLVTTGDMLAGRYGLPSFDVGTNYVPYDMTADIHAGERIIPAADNRALMERLNSPDRGNQALVAEIKALREEVARLHAAATATAGHTAKTARLLDRAMPDGDAIATREVTA